MACLPPTMTAAEETCLPARKIAAFAEPPPMSTFTMVA